VEPTRLRKESKAKEQLAEKHISRSCKKRWRELLLLEKEKMEGTRRQPMFLMERELN
jgi:hypothetical protein